MKQAAESGRELPEWYLEEPEVDMTGSFYMRAFWDLSTERQSGWTPGPIPWSRIVEYGERAGLEEVTIDVFIRTIRTLDNEYQLWHEGERKKVALKKSMGRAPDG